MQKHSKVVKNAPEVILRMNREKLESYLEKNPFAKLSDVVTQILYDEIVVLDIPPASKLNINQIATDFGISRTPVVEAINRLQAIGFVDTRPHVSGFYVTDMSLRDMIDLYDARTAIECEAAALCAEKASPEAIAQLDSLAAEFKKAAVPKLDGKRLQETDMPFHKLIVESSRNKYLIRSYNELLPNLTMYQGSWPKFISPDQVNPWSSQVVHQHGAIVSSIKLHIPALARQAMAEHIKSSLNFVAYSDNTDDPFWIVKRSAEKTAKSR